MRISAGCEIAYDCPQPTPMILMLGPHPSRDADMIEPPVVTFDPPLPARDYIDGFGNRCTRFVAPVGRTSVSTRFLAQDSGLADVHVPQAQQVPVQDLPDEALVYLLGSRYCDTDKLSTFAWQRFGQGPTGWNRVQAVCDYAHNHIRFDYQLADATRSASEGHHQQVGVCRDYAHLAVTLCRALNIPARYCTGFLGDIGVPPADAPMDYAAWFEAYLDGQWYTFDPRNNTPRIGRILVGRGRDATDVAIATTFGPCMLANFKVITDEVA